MPENITEKAAFSKAKSYVGIEKGRVPDYQTLTDRNHVPLIVRSLKLDRTSWDLYSKICRVTIKSGCYWGGERRLADELHVSVRTIERHLALLKLPRIELGAKPLVHIERTKKGNGDWGRNKIFPTDIATENSQFCLEKNRIQKVFTADKMAGRKQRLPSVAKTLVEQQSIPPKPCVYIKQKASPPKVAADSDKVVCFLSQKKAIDGSQVAAKDLRRLSLQHGIQKLKMAWEWVEAKYRGKELRKGFLAVLRWCLNSINLHEDYHKNLGYVRGLRGFTVRGDWVHWDDSGGEVSLHQRHSIFCEIIDRKREALQSLWDFGESDSALDRFSPEVRRFVKAMGW